MSSTARHTDRQRLCQRMISMALIGSGLLVAVAGATAQAPTRLSPPDASIAANIPASAYPPPPEVVMDAYDELSWTGQRAPVPVARKEARAALSAGRRDCNRMRQGAEREQCLSAVQQDYQEMMARLQARTSSR